MVATPSRHHAPTAQGFVAAVCRVVTRRGRLLRHLDHLVGAATSGETEPRREGARGCRRGHWNARFPGAPVMPSEPRYWIAFFSVSAVRTFGVSLTNADFLPHKRA